MKTRRGRFWKISDLAACMEVSQADIVASAKICNHPITVGGLIWFPKRPHRDFIGEAHRANQSRLSMESRRDARLLAG